MQANLLQLYLVTHRYEVSDPIFLEQIAQACQAGVTLVQLREKDLTTRDYYDLAVKVKQVTDRYHIPLIIDDRVDVCLAVDAAGVHIGDDELPVEVVRRLIGTKYLGVTAKTVERAQAAYRAGADYLGVGAIFPTQTKVKTRPTSLTTLRDIVAAVPIPVVAIGGLTEYNLSCLEDQSIAGIAVVSEIMQAEHIPTKVQRLVQLTQTFVQKEEH